MPKLPNAERAILDIRKIADYCLSPEHPRGRHKARVFRDALELKQDDAEWLRHALLDGLPNGEATELSRDDPWAPLARRLAGNATWATCCGKNCVDRAKR